ncbi:MAG: hypothetical protein R3F61_37955 [Myxococcota bacterium]
MFAGIRDDFDPRYWTQASVAILLAASGAVTIGAAWLVTELLSRIAWFLVALLAQWLFPPGLAYVIAPTPPITVELTNTVLDRDHRAGLKAVEVSLADDMGDFDYDPTPDPDFSRVHAPPDRTEMRAIEARLSDSVGLLALIGSSSSDNSLSNLFGSGGFDDDLAIGGLIGSIEGTSFGSGGLGMGSVGIGGGGTAEGLGGLGTRGTAVGGGGTGYGRIGTIGTARKDASVVERGTPKPDAEARAWLAEHPSATCNVRVKVHSDGSPSTTFVDCPSALRASATDAISRTKFRPAGEGGTNTVTIRYRFQ